MTYREIVAAIKGYEVRTKAKFEADMQLQAMIAYRQADLIASHMARIWGGKHKPPTMQEAFPGIFPEEQNKQQDWRVMKARLEAYADAWRRKRGAKKGDTGRAADPHHSEHGGATT